MTSTPSKDCKLAGLKSLVELSQITGKPVQTLINWHRDDPVLFNVVLTGAVAIKNKAAASDLATRLRHYNEWRRGGELEQPHPKQIGHDIDAAICMLEAMANIPNQQPE